MQMPRTKLHFSETVLSFGLKLNDFENLDVKRQFWREQRRDLRARSAFHHFIDTTLMQVATTPVTHIAGSAYHQRWEFH